MNGRLAALLAWLRPSRGRHSAAPPAAVAVPDDPAQAEDDDTIVWGVPPEDDDDGVSPADLTMFDLPPGRARPYIQPGDQEGQP